jgi:CRP/FNR family nitrogen fixation transcriptional regulator
MSWFATIELAIATTQGSECSVSVLIRMVPLTSSRSRTLRSVRPHASDNADLDQVRSEQPSAQRLEKSATPSFEFDVYQNNEVRLLANYANGSFTKLVNMNSGPPISANDLSALSRKRVMLNECRYRRGAEIFGEAEPARFVYQVVEGAVRSYKHLADGRRQISAFHLSGDMFGLENGTMHRFTAEAIVDTRVLLLRRQGVKDAADGDASVVQDLLRLTTKNLERVEDHMLLLGRKNSLERVVTFLIEMDRRLTTVGVMELPMGRRDIADYLGLTLETVSRALSMLHNERVLAFIGKTQRQIVLLDRDKLSRLGI